jgi:hypothetical protein
VEARGEEKSRETSGDGVRGDRDRIQPKEDAAEPHAVEEPRPHARKALMEDVELCDTDTRADAAPQKDT